MHRFTTGRLHFPREPVVLTVGHSNRSLEAFLDVLHEHGIERLMDIRTIPRSRHNPQFNRETLPLSLKEAGIAYSHAAGLGGLRRARPDSLNLGWHNASFRGFADYMQTPEFQAALKKLTKAAAVKRVALMCAEAVPWRCHRSLIADALTIRGIEVEHIMSHTQTRRHTLTPFANVVRTSVTYPGGERCPSEGAGRATISHDASQAKARRQAGHSSKSSRAVASRSREVVPSATQPGRRSRSSPGGKQS